MRACLLCAPYIQTFELLGQPSSMARAREIAVVLVRHGFGHFVEAWQLQQNCPRSNLAKIGR